MRYLKLFEEFEGEHISSHLRGRGIDPSKTRLVIDEETEDVYFFLYNLSGQMVGYREAKSYICLSTAQSLILTSAFILSLLFIFP